MKRSIAHIIGLFISLSLVGPAAAKDYMKLGNTPVPLGFCQTQVVDGVTLTGVRFDGVTYKVWLDKNALSDDRLKELTRVANLQRHAMGLPDFTDLEAAQFAAKVRADESQFQMSYVTRGQANLCPLVK